MFAADLEVAYHIGNDNEINTGKYGYHWWRGAVDQEYRRYKRGSLVIDVINPRDRQMVWRGSDRDVIQKLDEDQGRIDSSVKDIMKGFPPKK